MIRVLLADDHDFVRSTLVELFTATHDITVVAECSDGDQVLAAAERTDPDVVLLDLAMPRQTGLEAARALLSAHLRARIILLTANLSAAAVREAQAVGAVGYLLKGEDPGDLAQHVRAVASGGTAWSPMAIASATGTGEASSWVHSGSGERRHDENPRVHTHD